MTKQDLVVGFKFKSCVDDSSYGICISIENDRFIYNWIYPSGDSSTHSLKLDKVVGMFEHFGWVKLSQLEEELL